MLLLAPVVVSNEQWGLLPLGLCCSAVMLVAAISETRDAARLLVADCRMKLRGIVGSLSLSLVDRGSVVVYTLLVYDLVGIALATHFGDV